MVRIIIFVFSLLLPFCFCLFFVFSLSVTRVCFFTWVACFFAPDAAVNIVNTNPNLAFVLFFLHVFRDI